MENAATSDRGDAAAIAFLPGDSRIPDHSIWSHNAVTSAVAGCLIGNEVKPAFLLFQFGPVQDFIAQARSTRDLWSGSYLLSWLMAHAMKAVSDRIGPDAIIFPSLRGNGVFDALHREEIYSTLWADQAGQKMTTWERMLQEKGDQAAQWLLTPTLPNRFLALVPKSQAEELAQAAKDSIHAELKRIGEAVWSWLETEALKAGCNDNANWRKRWDAQIKAFPQVSYAIQPWLDRDACLAAYNALPVNKAETDTPASCLQDMLDFAEKWLPETDRDSHSYSSGKLNNPGVFWSAHYALVDAKLAARRNTRDFVAWDVADEESNSGASKRGTPKDSLSGKEECIGTEQFWTYLGKEQSKIFKTGNHRYGAMNFIKRLWCRPEAVKYLSERLGLSANAVSQALGADSVEDIAKNNLNGGNYVSILAMDGDKMGQWVSGEKTPQFLKQISDSARKYLEPILKAQNQDKKLRRLLTPSYHLQFSEALANFSTWLTEPIVEHFGGQLIYSGGDDVLAMLPADRAIACAQALRSVFRGEPPENQAKFNMAVTQPGYVNESAGYPLIVPGPEADVSIGLAVGHCNAPLQMLVREAQKAEKHAKNVYGRSALAVTLYKRSGETIEWGCKWDSIALELMRKVTEGAQAGTISGRFPYALDELLKPYKLGQKPDIPLDTLLAIIRQEFAHVVSRQARELDKADQAKLIEMANVYLEQTCQDVSEEKTVKNEKTYARMGDFLNLFLAETFINRNCGEN